MLFLPSASAYFPETVTRVDPFTGENLSYRLLGAALGKRGVLYGGYILRNSECMIFYKKTDDGMALVSDASQRLDLFIAFAQRYAALCGTNRHITQKIRSVCSSQTGFTVL